MLQRQKGRSAKQFLSLYKTFDLFSDCKTYAILWIYLKLNAETENKFGVKEKKKKFFP
jgi:hypothetical protein